MGAAVWCVRTRLETYTASISSSAMRLRCRDRLGAAEVGEVEAGVCGVELAGDVGVRLAVPHQQESHRCPQLLKGEVLDEASSKASSSETPSSASSMSVPTWLTSVPRSSGTSVWTSRSS